MKGFWTAVRAEWTKFRTVRGWVVATAAAAVAMVGLGLAPGMSGSCGKRGPGSECELPVGPNGDEVTDVFTFAHRPLTGDGSVTARVASMTGQLEGSGRAVLAPWAKAGLVVKDGTRPGSSYAAVMLTGAHGVRMQYDYTHDRAGSSGGGPRWLRLTRAGDTITGAESVDGAQWTDVGSARLRDLPSTVEIGLFATSPQYAEMVSMSIGSMGASTEPSQVTAVFDGVAPGGDWTGTVVGERGRPIGGYTRDGDRHTLIGTGDIAPATAGAAGLGTTITQTLVGTFAALIVMVVVGTLVATGEYRRGLIRTTLAAIPRRGRVLAAKALVVAAVTFVTGVLSAAVLVTLGQRVLRANGVYVHAVGTATELRVIAGTGALLAVAAVLALALGTLLRRGTTAVTAAVATIVLPYMLVLAALPVDAGRWVLRVTPAAAFALQQSAKQYDQVDNLYIPQEGYFPLAPWAGFGVLAAWTAVALAAAAWLLRRRDA